ncbi:MAG: hypothetical protein HY363_05280 [Candidatus Aenigmarchaeota archaeon]|nr:hypothetical protein [Candidatus Aenigmarchaeota archaeon]
MDDLVNLNLQLNAKLGKKVSPKGLEVLVRKLAGQNNVIKFGSQFEHSSDMLLAWYVYGKDVLKVLGNSNAERLVNVVRVFPDPVAYAILKNSSSLFAKVSGGFTERVLSASESLHCIAAAALFESVPKLANGADIFEFWFTNRTYTEDITGYLQLNAEGQAVFDYFRRGGKVPDILSHVHVFEGNDMIKAICAVEKIEKSEDPRNFLKYINNEAHPAVDSFYSEDSVLRSVLQEVYPLDVVLIGGFVASQKAKDSSEMMKRVGISADEKRLNIEPSRESHDLNSTERDYLTAVLALDIWMEGEHALSAFDRETAKQRAQYSAQIEGVSLSFAQLKQAEAGAARQTVHRSLTNNAVRIAERYFPKSEINAELKNFGDVEIDKNYFIDVCSRIRLKLESVRNELQTQLADFESMVEHERKEKLHMRDHNKQLFANLAVGFAKLFFELRDNHPFFYDLKGQRYLNIPAGFEFMASGGDTERFGEHLYFTKPHWRFGNVRA